MTRLSVTVHAVNLGQPVPGDVTAVVGCGIIGIDTIQYLKAAGAGQIIAVAKLGWQGEIARKYGATEVVLGGKDREPADEIMRLTEGWGVYQVYECVGGETDALQES